MNKEIARTISGGKIAWLLAILAALAVLAVIETQFERASAAEMPQMTFELVDTADAAVTTIGDSELISDEVAPSASVPDNASTTLRGEGVTAIPAHLVGSVDFVREFSVATNDFATVSMTNIHSEIINTGKSNPLDTRDELVLLAAIALTGAGFVSFGSAMVRCLGFRSDDVGRMNSKLNSKPSIDGATESRRISKRFGAPMRRSAVLTSLQGASIVT